jgi:hypothetical protein
MPPTVSRRCGPCEVAIEDHLQKATSEDSGITSEFPELLSTLLSGDILWLGAVVVGFSHGSSNNLGAIVFTTGTDNPAGTRDRGFVKTGL